MREKLANARTSIIMKKISDLYSKRSPRQISTRFNIQSDAR